MGAGELQAVAARGVGGLAGLAAAAGPIGLIASAAMELRHQVQEMGRRGVAAVGQTATRVGALDAKLLGDAVEMGAGAAIKAASMLPGVGPAIGIAGPAVVEGIRQVRAFGQALEATASRLAPYHGRLSEAEALADVRSMLGDYRRAQKLGDGLAKFVDARSKIEEDVRDLLADGLKPLLELIAGATSSMSEGIRTIRAELHARFPAWFSDPARRAAEEQMPFEEFMRAGEFRRHRPDPPPIAGRAGHPRLPLGGP
jgi:hypothetical protein